MSRTDVKSQHYPDASSVDEWLGRIWKAAHRLSCAIEPLPPHEFEPSYGVRHLRGARYVRFTPDGGLITINSFLVNMLGYEDEQVFYSVSLDKTWVDLTRRFELLNMITSQGAVNNFEAQLFNSSGEPIWVSINAVGE